jgi:hypothetical protein
MIVLSNAVNQIPKKYKELVNKNDELNKYRTKLVKEIDELKEEFDLEAANEIFSTANLDDWKQKEAERKKKLKEVEAKIDESTRKLFQIPSKKMVEPTREREKITEEQTIKQEELFKMKDKLKKLKDCDWDEKARVSGICNEVLERHRESHKSISKDGYKELSLMINVILDEKYQPGSQDEIDIISGSIKSVNKILDDLSNELRDYDEYYKITDRISKNDVVQKEINQLKKKKKNLEASEFDISSFMDYQKLCNMEKELVELDTVFDNLTKYSETHTKLNKVMSEIIKLEKKINDMEESRGNLKGSLGVIETEMKNVQEKKKKLEDTILEMDVLMTYQDCLKTVPFIIIDKVVPQLENTINMMLSNLVNFSLNFKVAEKELNVYITRAHGQIPLSNASGFEKFVGSLFLRIGLIKISNLPKANFLAVDEGWSNFDYDNMNNVGMIMDYLRNEFDFVILVSHLQSMREQTDQQINIKINQNISEVKIS